MCIKSSEREVHRQKHSFNYQHKTLNPLELWTNVNR